MGDYHQRQYGISNSYRVDAFIRQRTAESIEIQDIKLGGRVYTWRSMKRNLVKKLSLWTPLEGVCNVACVEKTLQKRMFAVEEKNKSSETMVAIFKKILCTKDLWY